MMLGMTIHRPLPTPSSDKWLRWLFRDLEDKMEYWKQENLRKRHMDGSLGEIGISVDPFALHYVHQGASTEEKALNDQAVLPDRATHVSSSVLSHCSAYTIGP